jgi:lipoprotein-anchoring transpeptidase ErfK/SrfK
MRLFGTKLLAASALLLSLAACVPDAGLVDAGLVAPPAPHLLAGVYGPVSDPQFTVPAVPVEKVPAEFQRQTLRYENETNQPVGTIIIDPSARHLYLLTGKKTAVRYGIAVGRAGFQWSGEALITDRKNWPTWTPPPEMIDRKPELAKWEKGQPGGPENPLGARALYLTTNGIDYGYRIHGTPEWFSIGKNASSGCIRMINQDVMDLFDRVPNGTKVIVLNADGSFPKGLNLPPKPPAKKKPAPAPAPILVAKPAVMPVPVVTGAAPVAAPAAAAPVLAPTKPAVLPTPAPAATEPVCKVPLVAGVCPPEVKTP